MASQQEARILSVRFEAARQLYNAVLSEALRRIDLMRQSRAWNQAQKLPRGMSGSLERKERLKAFSAVAKQFDLTDYALQSYATQCKNSCWIGEHLDAHVTQKLGTRVFWVAQRYQFRKGGRPRFKSHWKALESVEGKTNATGVRWRNGHVEWNGLSLSVRYDRKDRYGVQAHALQCPVKYCRIVRRTLRGKVRWFVQLILAGVPRRKEIHSLGGERISVAVAPGVVAVASDNRFDMLPYASQIPAMQRRIQRLRRAMDRSLRQANPRNYLPDGSRRKPLPGEVLCWVWTGGYLRLRARVAELQRRLVGYRRTEQRRLAHRILAEGIQLVTPKVPKSAVRRTYGRRFRVWAPRGFFEQLRRKAESAGGQLLEVPVRGLPSTQRLVVERPLVGADREAPRRSCVERRAQDWLFRVYEALWARRDVRGWVWDTERIREDTRAVESRLGKAVSEVMEAARRGRVPTDLGGYKLTRGGVAPS